jgi:hypothetical protein
MFKLNKKELAVLKKLNTPSKIQDFLNSLPFNFEKAGETYMSPKKVLEKRTAHCFEGALLASLALWIKGFKPLIMDLKSNKKDIDHVVALYKINGYWGAISKTNHYCLRFRDPIYKTVRELALSYFHEYFLNSTGEKTLISYSKPFDLSKLTKDWITSEEDLFEIVNKLDRSKHFEIVPQKNKKYIRKSEKIEKDAGKIIEWE